METTILDAAPDNIAAAAKLILQGVPVGMPTETVYGLAANAYSDDAVTAVFKVKGRPQDNPLIVHIAQAEDLQKVAGRTNKQARLLAGVFWPGPLTMVLPKGDKVAPSVSAGLDSVGVRLPAHPVARALIRAAGVPLAAPSANVSGSPSPTTAAHVKADLEGRIPLILDGGACPVGIESTVLSLVQDPVVLRPGFVTKEEIEDVLGCPVRYADSLSAPLAKDVVAASPGMKYRHYAPKAEITLINADNYDYIKYTEAEYRRCPGLVALCFDEVYDVLNVPAVAYGGMADAEGQAHGLFDALRRLDELGAQNVLAQAPPRRGVGVAVYNRLLRAAAFRVVDLYEVAGC